jgi:hypothetical protein
LRSTARRDDADGGDDAVGPSAQAVEHGAGVIRAGGFGEEDAALDHDCIGREDGRVREGGGDVSGLGGREGAGESLRAGSGHGVLVDGGRGNFEVVAEGGEELTPARRCGGEDKPHERRRRLATHSM